MFHSSYTHHIVVGYAGCADRLPSSMLAPHSVTVLVTHLTVQTQQQQHEEEERRPQRSHRHQTDRLRIRNKGQTRTWNTHTHIIHTYRSVSSFMSHLQNHEFINKIFWFLSFTCLDFISHGLETFRGYLIHNPWVINMSWASRLSVNTPHKFSRKKIHDCNFNSLSLDSCVIQSAVITSTFGKLNLSQLTHSLRCKLGEPTVMH